MQGSPLTEGAREVARRLAAAGFQAYFAGGCVRDLLLGASPKDFDIATDARPEDVKRLFRRRVEVGAAFGVVRVILEGGFEYEVATYRTEGTYGDGRRPDRVEYATTAEEDVHRRDFTINALLMDPETEAIIDHVGGRQDLADGVVRAVGDPHRRFHEDRLRMLRAVRFAARLGFRIEDETWTAMKVHAPEIRVVSRERIATELHGIWLSSRPGKGLSFLRESGLLAPVLPFLAGGPPAGLDELEARMARLPELFLPDEARLVVAWALHLDHHGAELVRPWSQRLVQDFKLSRVMAREIGLVLEARALLLGPEAARLGRCRQLMLSPGWPVAFGFLRAHQGDEGAPVVWWRAALRDLEEAPPALEARLGGEDLRAMGRTPGPEFKEVLEAVELEVLEGRLRSKDEARAWVASTLSADLST